MRRILLALLAVVLLLPTAVQAEAADQPWAPSEPGRLAYAVAAGCPAGTERAVRAAGALLNEMFFAHGVGVRFVVQEDGNATAAGVESLVRRPPQNPDLSGYVAPGRDALVACVGQDLLGAYGEAAGRVFLQRGADGLAVSGLLVMAEGVAVPVADCPSPVPYAPQVMQAAAMRLFLQLVGLEGPAAERGDVFSEELRAVLDGCTSFSHVENPRPLEATLDRVGALWPMDAAARAAIGPLDREAGLQQTSVFRLFPALGLHPGVEWTLVGLSAVTVVVLSASSLLYLRWRRNTPRRMRRSW